MVFQQVQTQKEGSKWSYECSIRVIAKGTCSIKRFFTFLWVLMSVSNRQHLSPVPIYSACIFAAKYK